MTPAATAGVAHATLEGCHLTSQAIGTLLRNQLYAGIVGVPE
jgi:hypothetical protein